FFFFFQAEDGIRDRNVTGVQTCALPISIRGGLSLLPFLLGGGEAFLALFEICLHRGHGPFPFFEGCPRGGEVPSRGLDRLRLRREVDSQGIEFLVILIGLLSSALHGGARLAKFRLVFRQRGESLLKVRRRGRQFGLATLERVIARVDFRGSDFLGVEGGSEGLVPVIQFARATVEAGLLFLEFRGFFLDGRLSQRELLLGRGQGGPRRPDLPLVGRGLGLAGA